MKITTLAAVAAMGIAVSGCATIVQGTTETVSVNSIPEEGASCSLHNSEGTWYVTTPGSVTVHKTKTNLIIRCKKDGFTPVQTVATSRFGGTTAGNIIAGGVIGLAVDAASGANYYYDSPVTVSLGVKAADAAPKVTKAPSASQPTS